MSWSVHSYSQQKRDVQPIKSEDIGDTNFKSETPNESSTKLVSHNRLLNTETKRSKNQRRCYNCGSATHLLKNCSVPPASVRRTNYHREKMGVNHQQRNRSGNQNSCEHSVHDKFQQQPSEQYRLPKVNEIFLEANVGKDKTPIFIILLIKELY